MSIILFQFESSEIRFVGTAEKPLCVAADVCKLLGLGDVSDAVAKLDEDEKGRASIPDGSLTGSQMLVVTESGLYTLILRHRQATTPGTIAHRFRKWVTDEILPSVRKTGSYLTEEERQKLERKLLPTPALKQIGECSTALKKAGISALYIERLAIANIKKHYPELLSTLPEPSELRSLPAARAFLNPTKIAEELGWLCKTGKCSGNAAKVNSLLKELGYQDTDKAIAANLVDRKPVETNSRTQKDQLLWSADIISILQEHSVPSPAPACYNISSSPPPSSPKHPL
jgi:prophage antirepressor-like protein